MKPSTPVWRHVLLISGLLLISVNLRPAITGLAPLAERMRADGVSVALIGLQTTLPLVMFGLAGFFAGAIGNRFGFARVLGAALLILAAGCFLRTGFRTDTVFGPLVGSLLIGSGIALGNVLLPGIVKSRYPEHLGVMTSLYSTAMNLGGTFGIALAVPLATSLPGGWTASLSAWGYAALLPLLPWLPQLLQKPTVRRQHRPFSGIIRLLKNARAWQVTAQMGIQSLLFYSCVAWLPTILRLRGMTESESYGWPTAMQICGSAASLVIPTLAGRARSQSLWTAACAVMSVLGICGILWLPAPWVGASTIALGLGLNASFSMVLLIITLRSEDAEAAGNLSSMAQSFGYLVAAPFPWLIGSLSEVTGSWFAAYGFLLVPALAVVVAGSLAGRAGTIR